MINAVAYEGNEALMEKVIHQITFNLIDISLIKKCMKVNGKMIKPMDMESTICKTVQISKAFRKMINRRGLKLRAGLMAQHTKDNSKMVIGKKAGKGAVCLKDGSSYEGEFIQNVFHGKGIYIWGDGRMYKGN